MGNTPPTGSLQDLRDVADYLQVEYPSRWIDPPPGGSEPDPKEKNESHFLCHEQEAEEGEEEREREAVFARIAAAVDNGDADLLHLAQTAQLLDPTLTPTFRRGVSRDRLWSSIRASLKTRSADPETKPLVPRIDVSTIPLRKMRHLVDAIGLSTTISGWDHRTSCDLLSDLERTVQGTTKSNCPFPGDLPFVRATAKMLNVPSHVGGYDHRTKIDIIRDVTAQLSARPEMLRRVLDMAEAYDQDRLFWAWASQSSVKAFQRTAITVEEFLARTCRSFLTKCPEGRRSQEMMIVNRMESRQHCSKLLEVWCDMIPFASPVAVALGHHARHGLRGGSVSVAGIMQVEEKLFKSVDRSVFLTPLDRWLRILQAVSKDHTCYKIYVD